MFQIHRLVLHGDGLLHRDDMHADPRAAGRHHLGDPRQGDKGHALEEGRHVRVIPQPRVAAVRQFFHIEKLRRTGHKHGQDIPTFRLRCGASVVIIVITVIILQQPYVTHLIQKLLKFFLAVLIDVIQFTQFRKGVGRPLFHGEPHFRHLLGDDLRKPPVLGILHLHPADHVSRHIRDLLPQRNDLLAGLLVMFVIRRPSVVLLHVKCHSCSPPVPIPVPHSPHSSTLQPSLHFRPLLCTIRKGNCALYGLLLFFFTLLN